MNTFCPVCQRPVNSAAAMGLCPACLLKRGFPSVNPQLASQFVPPSLDEIAGLFPQLEILTMLGQGGMGAVYQARQKQLNRLIALKILPPAIGADPAFAERFTREAQALALLNHPGIVGIYEFGKAGPLPYFFMEFMDGGTLRQLLARKTLLPREALAIVSQICDALQFAHDHGIVHRDIKLDNILLDRHGRVKVADFGLAKMIGSGQEGPTGVGLAGSGQELTESGNTLGTPRYMSPEQASQPERVDHRTDIFALGVVFYQLLTGELPGEEVRNPSLDKRLESILQQALQKDPAQRYQQASKLKADVESVAAASLAGSAASKLESPVSEHNLGVALILAFFFGVFGAHRFYVGKTGTAFLQLFSLGGLGIWTTIDLIILAFAAFKDSEGRRLVWSSLPAPARALSGKGGGAQPRVWGWVIGAGATVLLLLLLTGVGWAAISFLPGNLHLGTGAISWSGSELLVGSGEVISEERSVAGFSRIELSGSAQLEASVGAETNLSISAEDNLLPAIETTVSNGTLLIRFTKSLRSKAPIKIRLSSPTLEALRISGSSTATIRAIDSQSFTLDLSGSGKVSLAGSAQTAKLRIAGAGSLQAGDLIAEKVKITILGAGEALVYATETLDAKISGAGDVRYRGTPAQVQKTVTGAGSIRQVK